MVGDVDLGITSKAPMLFLCFPSTRKPMCVDLLLNLVGFIGHEDAAVGVAGAHLGLRPLESGEELRMDESRFLVLQFLRYVPSEAEIGILVDGAGDQAGDVADRTEYMRETVGERRSGLDGRKVYFADVVPDSRSVT